MNKYILLLILVWQSVSVVFAQSRTPHWTSYTLFGMSYIAKAKEPIKKPSDIAWQLDKQPRLYLDYLGLKPLFFNKQYAIQYELEPFFEKLYSLPRDEKADEAAQYKLHFIERREWRTDPGGFDVYDNHTLKQFNATSYTTIKELTDKRTNTSGIKSLNSFGQKYAVLVFSYWYIGNSAMGEDEVYYLEKI